MNANELADKLETEDCCTLDMEAVADMLRQQQAEIANLKAGLLSHHDIYPVKELTDEEIEKVIRKHWNKQYGSRNMLTLCKAVLKEAQEK